MIFSFNRLQLLKSYIDRFIASVAQLDRVSASEAECRVFKSPRTPHTFLYKLKTYKVLKAIMPLYNPCIPLQKAVKKQYLLVVVFQTIY